MEPKVEVYYKKDGRKNCCCLYLIVGLVAAVLAFFIGVLVAALTGIITTITVGGLIAIVVALAVAFIVAVINTICCKLTDKKKFCC